MLPAWVWNFTKKERHSSSYITHVKGCIGYFREFEGLHGKKVPLEKILKFYFGLKHPKMTTLEGGSEVGSALVLKSICPSTSQKSLFIPRIALLFSRNALLFSGIALLFSRSPFFSSKIPYCFPELPFSMLRVTNILENLWMEYDFLFILFNFGLHDSLENEVSKHLEWLKFKKTPNLRRLGWILQYQQ